MTKKMGLFFLVATIVIGLVFWMLQDDLETGSSPESLSTSDIKSEVNADSGKQGRLDEASKSIKKPGAAAPDLQAGKKSLNLPPMPYIPPPIPEAVPAMPVLTPAIPDALPAMPASPPPLP